MTLRQMLISWLIFNFFLTLIAIAFAFTSSIDLEMSFITSGPYDAHLASIESRVKEIYFKVVVAFAVVNGMWAALGCVLLRIVNRLAARNRELARNQSTDLLTPPS